MNIVVKNAVSIARMMEVSEKFIGITIVALGTSLPELVTSIIAIKKKRFGLAMGNVIGSNLFNIFLVLGVTAVINPISYPVALNIDFYFLRTSFQNEYRPCVTFNGCDVQPATI